jgi:hypothetical protein
MIAILMVVSVAIAVLVLVVYPRYMAAIEALGIE